MCDTLIKENIPKNEQPKFVYKRVQKVAEGEYISAVMGEPMKMGVWKTAPKRKRFKKGSRFIRLLNRKHKLSDYCSASSFADHHNGKWAAFAKKNDAIYSVMVSNFTQKVQVNPIYERYEYYPTVVVKCQIGGTVHKSAWGHCHTYLFSAIKIVEEVCATY